MSDAILHMSKVDTHEESPFGMFVTLNGQYLQGKNTREIHYASVEILKQLQQQMNAVSSTLKNGGEDLLNRLNSLHNTICAKNIEWKKSLYEQVKMA